MANQWIKLYTEILHDRKFRKMTIRQQLVCLKVFLLAGQEDQDGLLPPLEDISLELYMPNLKELRQDLDRLTELGILDYAHGSELWTVINFQKRQESNLTGYERVKRYREKGKVINDNADDNTADVINDNAMITRKNAQANSDTVISDTKMITVERDIDIEEEKNINNTPSTTAKKPAAEKHQHGSFRNVLLTDAELQKLRDRFPDADERIEHFSKKKAAKGYVYKSDYAAILSWAQDKAEQPRASVTIPTRRPTNAELIASLELEGLDE